MPKSHPPTIATSQEFLDIEDIASDLVLLPGGAACMVLEVSAINFGLLSENEQDATIYSYAQLLNSLTFSIQIVITSRQKDISDYIKLLDNRLTQTTAPLLREQLGKYRDFVKSVVRQGNVLDKRFYVVITFSSLEASPTSALSSLFQGRSKSTSSLSRDTIIDHAATNLSPKRDHLIRLFARIGLKARQLKSPELLQLFFDLYNRDLIGSRVKLPV